MKFKAGDIVWCNKKGKYNYTNYHVVCKVVGYNPANLPWTLKVIIIEEGCSGLYQPFHVNEKDFEKVKAVVL